MKYYCMILTLALCSISLHGAQNTFRKKPNMRAPLAPLTEDRNKWAIPQTQSCVVAYHNRVVAKEKNLKEHARQERQARRERLEKFVLAERASHNLDMETVRSFKSSPSGSPRPAALATEQQQLIAIDFELGEQEHKESSGN